MRADEYPVADGRRAAIVAAARDANGDVLREAAVVADACFRREDDRAIVPDVEPVADLALRRDADAGDDFHELLRRDDERREQRATLQRASRYPVDGARPESLREEEGTERRVCGDAV